MNRIKSLLTALAVSAPLAVSSFASAQAYPASVYVQPADQAQPVYVQAAQQALGVVAMPIQAGRAMLRGQRGMQRIEKTGTVRSFVAQGRRLRGVTLTDGTTVLLRGNNQGQLRRLRPGALVRVRGIVMPGNATIIREASLTALRMRHPRFPAPPPVLTPAPTQPPVVVVPAPATPVAMRSTIRSVQWGANGLPQALLLANGRTVHLPSAMGRALAQRGVHIGERITITMHATPNRAFVADSVTFSNGARIGTATAANPYHFGY